jgi:hypothetical protein
VIIKELQRGLKTVKMVLLQKWLIQLVSQLFLSHGKIFGSFLLNKFVEFYNF